MGREGRRDTGDRGGRASSFRPSSHRMDGARARLDSRCCVRTASPSPFRQRGSSSRCGGVAVRRMAAEWRRWRRADVAECALGNTRASERPKMLPIATSGSSWRHPAWVGGSGQPRGVQNASHRQSGKQFGTLDSRLDDLAAPPCARCRARPTPGNRASQKLPEVARRSKRDTHACPEPPTRGGCREVLLIQDSGSILRRSLAPRVSVRCPGPDRSIDCGVAAKGGLRRRDRAPMAVAPDAPADG